ncbi:hypothetical protein Tco_0024368, partial [Tanacetum coccineum]
RPYALSWKPCQGDSLNLPDHRIHKDGDGDASFQLKSDSLPHAHAQTTKTFHKHQDSRIMKAQELKTPRKLLILKISPQKSSFRGEIVSQAFKMMQSMSMLVKTQDRKVAKTIKTKG